MPQKSPQKSQKIGRSSRGGGLVCAGRRAPFWRPKGAINRAIGAKSSMTALRAVLSRQRREICPIPAFSRIKVDFVD